MTAPCACCRTATDATMGLDGFAVAACGAACASLLAERHAVRPPEPTGREGALAVPHSHAQTKAAAERLRA